MYLIRETKDGFFVDYTIKGHLLETYFVRFKPRKECSCKFFTESHNCHNHFHINVVEKWIKDGKPQFAMYDKDKNGKIKTICEGIK